MSNSHLSLRDLMERLNTEGRQALAIALGEALRIGHFWLGIEFLLMGLSKQEGNVFPELLGEMEVHPGQFRGMLRGIVNVTTENDWRKQDVFALGAEALPRLQVADPDQLRRSFQAGEIPPPVLTPRMFTILKDAAKLSDEGPIGHIQLFGATLRHPYVLAMEVFFSMVSQVGWSHEQLIGRLAELIGVKPEDLLEETPKPDDVSPPFIDEAHSGQSSEVFQTLRGTVVTPEVGLEVMTDRITIPVEQLTKIDKQRLLELEDTLKQHVIGQDEAIAQVVRVVKRAGAGLTDPRRPLGVFLFTGPTGVGKTKLALALTEALFDREDVVCHLDMAEFTEKSQIARLVGVPQGSVGYEAEGQLTGYLRRRPYSVVLLDEIEKAHEDVQRFLLQLFDTGHLTDSQGSLADGRNAIFIMTTNLGAKEALGVSSEDKSYQEKLKAAVDEHFTRKFVNSIDRIVYFEPLDEDALLAILDLEFEPFQTRMREETEVEVIIDPNVKRQIAAYLAKQLRGAHSLRRYIEDYVVAPMVDKLLAGRYKPGTRVKIAPKLKFPVEKSDSNIKPGQNELDSEHLNHDESGQPEPQPPIPKRPATPEEALPHLDNVAEEFQQSFDKRFLVLARQLSEQDIALEIERRAKDFLCAPHNQGLQQRGDRSPEQAFEDLIEEPLTDKLLSEEFQEGDWIRIDKKSDEIVFEKMEE
jgi:MoxR-like ATPase